MTTSQAEPVRLDMKGPVPIAIGTEVEVRILEEKGSGFLAASRRAPVITELRTGIIYAPDWTYLPQQGTDGFLPLVPLETRPGLIMKQHFRGRVLACRVLSMSYQGLELITTLLVAPEPAVETYR